MTTTWQRGTIRGSDTSPISPILKFGGSLLTRSDWPTAVAKLVHQFDQPLLVIGGGSVVDGLRTIDQANPRRPPLMHELAIEAMTLTARLVADALDVPLVTAADSTMVAVLNVARWLDETEVLPRLPATWDVTSDSLAALVAVDSQRPLILVKSVPPPASAETLASLAGAGWVDAYFPSAASTISVIHWVSPRGDTVLL